MLPLKQTHILMYIPITHLWTSSWASCELALRMMVVCKLLLLMVSFEVGNEVILSCRCGKWLQIEDLFLTCFHQDQCSRLQICSCNVCCTRTKEFRLFKCKNVMVYGLSRKPQLLLPWIFWMKFRFQFIDWHKSEKLSCFWRTSTLKSSNIKFELHAAVHYKWQLTFLLFFIFYVFIWFTIIHHYLCQCQI
jgi:hypothetical protein